MKLSEALAPLYESYLRRLDEMAARLPAEAVLPEAITRADDGRLLLGDDGMVKRFDVANGATGETFEVHGSKPDQPLASELRVGALSVRLEPGNWKELPIVCVFDGEPLPEDAESLADLLRAFAVFAGHGAFAGQRPQRGTPEAERWSGRLHAVRVELREHELWTVFDLGTCPPQGVETLVQALAGYSDERVPLAWVKLGGPAPAP
jgi:hypothetical protein